MSYKAYQKILQNINQKNKSCLFMLEQSENDVLVINIFLLSLTNNNNSEGKKLIFCKGKTLFLVQFLPLIHSSVLTFCPDFPNECTL